MMFKQVSVATPVLAMVLIAAGCQESSNNAAAPANGAGAPTPTVRAPSIEPLKATFTPENFTTVYEAKITNPDADELFFAWAGPRCGVFAQDKPSCADRACTAKFSWDHGSPACPPHNNHDDTTVVLQAVGKRSGRTVICIYNGSESGTGPKCYQNGFDGSELGVTQPNQVFLRYHLPLGTRCSTVNLIQIVSYLEKATGAVKVPHTTGMKLDDLPFGYNPPSNEDDVGGYVVDKYKSTEANDPYYGGSIPGTPTQDAELDDRPGNTAAGHIARFEVCALCTANPGDAEYGKYLDCISWEHDPDIPIARRADPQPTQKPTPEFNAAVAKWNENKRFTMPGK